MKKYIYCLNKNILETDDEEYEAYDIEVWVIKEGKYHLAQCVPNVFLEYQRAKNFIDLCNSLEISLIHLTDLIEDEFS